MFYSRAKKKYGVVDNVDHEAEEEVDDDNANLIIKEEVAIFGKGKMKKYH